jgi:hypothetical protein
MQRELGALIKSGKFLRVRSFYTLFFQVKTVANLVELCGQVHQDMNDICITLLYGYITRPGDF